MMNDTAFVIYGFVNSLISKWLFFQSFNVYEVIEKMNMRKAL